MRTAARLLTLLALLVAVAGAAALFLEHRPTSPRAALEMIRGYAPSAAANPWMIAAAGTTIGASLLAWVLDHRERARLYRDTRYALDAVVPAHEAPEPPIPVAAEELPQLASAPPVIAPELRARLARHLGRRPDLLSWLDELMIIAIESGASDVHVQPQAESCPVALRIGGNLGEVANLPLDLHAQLMRRLKVMARLPPYRTESPQDGRIGLETPSGSIDVRLSLIPTQHGEKAALRLSPPSSSLFDLGELGLPPTLLSTYRRLLAQPQGLIVVTGPTGSGKTTTLYSSLQHVHRQRGAAVQVATIEEPIEIDLPFAHQTEVRRAHGLDFAAGLRALLRQDPNVLMVGEIRDRETAATAVEAGLTGHLILTTLHADSAAGVFNRLIDLEIEPFLVASATLACLSQRLARRLCAHCRQPSAATAEQAERLARHGIVPGERPLFRALGCEACRGSGFAGRLAIFELLEVTRALRQQVTAKAPTQLLIETAAAEGTGSLATHALRLAEAGEISTDELLRVLG